MSVSPHHEERVGGRAPDILLLHYTGMTDATAAIAKLCGAGEDPKVSSHYFVHADGRIVQLVQESRRAWHAGLSSWEGDIDINSRSIGIEIDNPGHEFGYPDFPPAQIEAVIALGRDIVGRRRIRADRVLAHSDVAPARKEDPGEKFPWRRLHAAGVGHWVEPAPFTDAPYLAVGDCGSVVSGLQMKLSDYGYGIGVTGRYDAGTRDVVAAFQRHFRPARIDGVADWSTVKTLDALLASRPARAA